MFVSSKSRLRGLVHATRFGVPKAPSPPPLPRAPTLFEVASGISQTRPRRITCESMVEHIPKPSLVGIKPLLRVHRRRRHPRLYHKVEDSRVPGTFDVCYTALWNAMYQ